MVYIYIFVLSFITRTKGAQVKDNINHRQKIVYVGVIQQNKGVTYNFRDEFRKKFSSCP